MSVSLFKMLFGAEEGRLPEPDPRHTAAQADGMALGLAMEQHGHRDQSPARCDMLIAEQAKLLQLQAAGLIQEQPLRMAHLRSLLQESKFRRTAQRLRIGVIALAALVSVMIGVAIIGVLYGALTSNSVVVEAFDTPDVLSEKGLSSKVLANALLDNLTRLQAASRTREISRNVTWAWANDIKIELPRTGISLGDLERFLRAHLGRDIHIQGDIVLRDGGSTLALSMRGDGVMPKTFTSNSGDLDKLIMQAAEYIYGQAEPARYAGYLVHVGRNADAIAFSRAAYAAAPAKKRPGILNAWANAIVGTGGALDNAKVLYVEALRLRPDYWLAYSNLANLYITKGEEEEVWKLGRDMLRMAGGRPGRVPEVDYINIDLVTWNLQAWRAALYENVKAYGGVGSATVAEEPQIADVDVRLHDVEVASLMLQTAEGDGGDPGIEALRHFVRGRIAIEAGQSLLAATEMEAFGTAFRDPVIAGNFAGFNCWIAPAEEAVGRHADADEALRAGGHYVDCYRFRADILDSRGDWPAAQKAYEAAMALAPDLPAAYYSWGLALIRHGDYQGARAKLKEAVERGPHWADPQKALGDIEAAEGRWPQALAYFTAALEYAPAWRELQQSRDAALKRQKPN